MGKDSGKKDREVRKKTKRVRYRMFLRWRRQKEKRWKEVIRKMVMETIRSGQRLIK